MDEKTLYIETLELGMAFTYYQGLSYACTFTNATKIISCTVNDPNGYIQTVHLDVAEVSPSDFNTSIHSASTAGSSTVTMVYDLDADGTNVTGKVYKYDFWVEFNSDDRVMLISDYVDYLLHTSYGMAGLLAALILIMTMALIGLWHPAASLMLGIGGLIASFALGLVTLSMSSMVGIVIVVGIILVRMMR